MKLEKIKYYLEIASVVAKKSTCLRRKYGAVLVKNDQIISTGYNGSPRGTQNCNDLNYCEREKQQIPSGQRYELCKSVHAEANAIIHAGREKCIDATLFVFGWDAKLKQPIKAICCQMCERFVINSGLKLVVCSTEIKGEFLYFNVLDDFIKPFGDIK